MRFISTHDPSVSASSFREAVLTGGAPDGGIWLPANSGALPAAFVRNVPGMTLNEIAYGVASAAVGDELPSADIKMLVDTTFTFDIPLVNVSDTTFRLELFHGPTRTHKDIGARFTAQLIRLYQSRDEVPAKVNVVTSVNDSTAVSVATAFADLPEVNNMLVFNRGGLRKDISNELKRISPSLRIVEMGCDRRRCDALVREAVCQSERADGSYLTTVNAMNPSVLLVRVIFFFQAYARLVEKRLMAGFTGDAILGNGAVFVIPDSNPAMATAARLAADMGLPIKRSIIMPEQKMARYGRYLEEGELGVALATFPTRISVNDFPASGIKIPATLPALKKFLAGSLSRRE